MVGGGRGARFPPKRFEACWSSLVSRITLMATGRCNLSSCAAYTSPMPPSPSFRVSADVNAADADGRTPLMMAAMQGWAGAAKALLANKAAINARDHEGALRSTMPILETTRLRTCFKRLDQSRPPDIPAVRSVTPSVLSTGLGMIRRSSTAAPGRNSARLLRSSKRKIRCRQPENLIRQPGRLSRFAEHRRQINSMPFFSRGAAGASAEAMKTYRPVM